jgi:hypothetical protein
LHLLHIGQSEVAIVIANASAYLSAITTDQHKDSRE